MSVVSYTFCPCQEFNPSGEFKNAPFYIAVYSLQSRLPDRRIFNIRFDLFVNGERGSFTPNLSDTEAFGVTQTEFRAMLRCEKEKTLSATKRCMQFVRPDSSPFKRALDL